MKKSLLLSLLIGLFVVHLILFKGFIVDDAFITFRYVQQWVHGHGLVYNVGERVEGYSNFLWIVLLVPLAGLGVELTLAAKAMGALLCLLTLLLVWKASGQIGHPRIAPWLLAVSSPFAAWALGGLETPLFTFLLFLSGSLFLKEEEEEKGWLSGPLFGLLALSRPEGLLFALSTVLFRIWYLYRLKKPPSRRDGWRAASCGGIFIPYFLWRWAYYGYPLPNTVYAKSLGLHPRAFLEGGFYLYASIKEAGGLFFLAVPLVLAWTSPGPSLLVRYWSLNLGLYALFVILGGGDWMPLQRFLVHLLPALFLLVQAGFHRLLSLWPDHWRKMVLLLLIGGQMGYFLGVSAEHRFIEGIGGGPLVPRDNEMVRFLQRNVRPGDTIALTDAGYLAYRLPLEVRVVDMVGLTDEHIAHRPVQLPGGLLGRGDAFGKWDIDYVLAQRPRFVQVNIVAQTPEGKWVTNFTGTTLLVNDPRFQRTYRPVDEPGISGLFVREP
jgi:hypothetical protein